MPFRVSAVALQTKSLSEILYLWRSVTEFSVIPAEPFLLNFNDNLNNSEEQEGVCSLLCSSLIVPS